MSTRSVLHIFCFTVLPPAAGMFLQDCKSESTDMSLVIAFEAWGALAKENIIVCNEPTLRSATNAVLHVYGSAL